jgi:hypothetical protein
MDEHDGYDSEDGPVPSDVEAPFHQMLRPVPSDVEAHGQHQRPTVTARGPRSPPVPAEPSDDEGYASAGGNAGGDGVICNMDIVPFTCVSDRVAACASSALPQIFARTVCGFLSDGLHRTSSEMRKWGTKLVDFLSSIDAEGCVAASFDEETTQGKQRHDLFTRLIDPDPRRGATWRQTAATAGDSSSVAWRSARDAHHEVSELIYIGARLYCNAFASKLARAFQTKALIPISCLLAGQCDDASFKLRVPVSASKKRASIADHGASETSLAKKRMNVQNEQADAKVNYSTLSYSALVWDPTSKAYMIYRGDLPCNLQNAINGRAENISQAQLERYDVPGFSSHWFESQFPFNMRVHTQDKSSANQKTINALRLHDKAEGRKRIRLALPCDIHPTASVQTHCWKIVDTHISGMLSLSMAQRGPGRLGDLQRIVGEECVKMLRVVRTHCATRTLKRHVCYEASHTDIMCFMCFHLDGRSVRKHIRISESTTHV